MDARKANETEVSVNKPRLSVAIVRDRSGSMQGVPIKSENVAITEFFEQGRISSKTGRRTDVAIVGFDTDAYVELDWMQMDQASPELDSNASGMTNLNDGIMLALKKIDEKRAENDSKGIPPSAPLLIVLTDGVPTSFIDESVEAVNARLRKNDKNGLKTFMMMSIYMDSPENTQEEREEAIKTLSRYAGGVFRADSRNYNEIFSFIHDSIKAIHDSGGDKKVNINPGEHHMQYVSLN